MTVAVNDRGAAVGGHCEIDLKLRAVAEIGLIHVGKIADREEAGLIIGIVTGSITVFRIAGGKGLVDALETHGSPVIVVVGVCQGAVFIIAGTCILDKTELVAVVHRAERTGGLTRCDGVTQQIGGGFEEVLVKVRETHLAALRQIAAAQRGVHQTLRNGFAFFILKVGGKTVVVQRLIITKECRAGGTVLVLQTEIKRDVGKTSPRARLGRVAGADQSGVEYLVDIVAVLMVAVVTRDTVENLVIGVVIVQRQVGLIVVLFVVVAGRRADVQKTDDGADVRPEDRENHQPRQHDGYGLYLDQAPQTESAFAMGFAASAILFLTYCMWIESHTKSQPPSLYYTLNVVIFCKIQLRHYLC